MGWAPRCEQVGTVEHTNKTASTGDSCTISRGRLGRRQRLWDLNYALICIGGVGPCRRRWRRRCSTRSLTRGRRERMYTREHINLLILFIQQVLEIPNFRLQGAHSFLQRLGISTRESTATELVASFAFEADIGALCTTGTDAVATDFLASATITGLGDTTLRAVPDLDHFHRENSRHVGRMLWRICLGKMDRTGSGLGE